MGFNSGFKVLIDFFSHVKGKDTCHMFSYWRLVFYVWSRL